jgi:hypothetical protein
MVRLCSALCVFAVSGCGLILDFDPPDEMPGSLDAAFDTSHVDASEEQTDASLVADAAMSDAWRADGSFDASSDAARDGSFDADPDAEIPPDPCADEVGLCIRFHHDGLDLVSIRSIMYWTEGTETVESGWTFETCVGGLRVIDATTSDCLFHAIPLPISRIIYFYPVSVDGPACTSLMCPGFPTAWEYWQDTVPVSGIPGVGPVSLERRPTPDGMIMAIKYTIF